MPAASTILPTPCITHSLHSMASCPFMHCIHCMQTCIVLKSCHWDYILIIASSCWLSLWLIDSWAAPCLTHHCLLLHTFVFKWPCMSTCICRQGRGSFHILLHGQVAVVLPVQVDWRHTLEHSLSAGQATCKLCVCSAGWCDYGCLQAVAALCSM